MDVFEVYEAIRKANLPEKIEMRKLSIALANSDLIFPEVEKLDGYTLQQFVSKAKETFPEMGKYSFYALMCIVEDAYTIRINNGSA